MKALFIGNSYTYCNDLPGMVKRLSQSSGKAIETASVASGGKSLEWHWYNPATLDAIAEGGWDWVVLQEQSVMPVEEPEKFRRAALRLGGRIRAIGAMPILFLTWARQHMPEMQVDLTESYMRVAGEIGAKVAPVGPGWGRALSAEPGLSLYESDRSHPTILGTYLVACVFFATLFGESPIGLPREFVLAPDVTAVVDKNAAGALQKAAWESVQECSGRIP